MTSKELISILDQTEDIPVYIGIEDNKLRYVINHVLCLSTSISVLCSKETPEVIIPKRSTIFLTKQENGKVSVTIRGYIDGEQTAVSIMIDLNELNKRVNLMNQQEVIPVSNPEWYKD